MIAEGTRIKKNGKTGTVTYNPALHATVTDTKVLVKMDGAKKQGWHTPESLRII